TPQGKVQEPGADRVVREAVDQDETAGIAVLLVRVERDRPAYGEVAHADLVQLQFLGREMFESVHVHPILWVADRRRDGVGADLQPIGPTGEHRLIAHPNAGRFELVGYFCWSVD